eukprot:s1278_g6.t1
MAKHLVAEKLGPSFGQGGDFTVVVEHPHGSVEAFEEEPKRTEFKVWSVILSSWSEVPALNLGSTNLGLDGTA